MKGFGELTLRKSTKIITHQNVFLGELFSFVLSIIDNSNNAMVTTKRKTNKKNVRFKTLAAAPYSTIQNVTSVTHFKWVNGLNQLQ